MKNETGSQIPQFVCPCWPTADEECLAGELMEAIANVNAMLAAPFLLGLVAGVLSASITFHLRLSLVATVSLAMVSVAIVAVVAECGWCRRIRQEKREVLSQLAADPRTLVLLQKVLAYEATITAFEPVGGLVEELRLKQNRRRFPTLFLGSCARSRLCHAV